MQLELFNAFKLGDRVTTTWDDREATILMVLTLVDGHEIDKNCIDPWPHWVTEPLMSGDWENDEGVPTTGTLYWIRGVSFHCFCRADELELVKEN